MKKWMIILFFAILLVPNALGLMTGKKETENTENRELAKWPEFSLENVEEYPERVENYINDHAPFRSFWLDSYASFNMELFHSIDNREVIVGKEGWLFYSGGVMDALGIGLYSEPEMAQILEKLLKVRERYAGGDAERFVFLIAPNKENVYRQYMPDDYWSRTGTSRALQLVEYLRENSDIKVIYPLEELRTASLEKQIFYKTDTHWNQLGGFIGAQEVIGAIGGEAMDYHRLSLTEIPGERGDLGNLGHTPMRYLTDEEIVIEGYYEDSAIEYAENGGVICTRTLNAPDPRRLTILRDSFAIALADVFYRYFGETVFIDRQMAGSAAVAEHQGDVLVYEIVERNLGMVPEDLQLLLEE